MKRKFKLCMWIAIFLVAVLILAPFSLHAGGESEKQVDYLVSFVDESNYENKIFNTQRGSLPEGMTLSISFPEQIVGNDGYLWRSVEPSPYVVEVHQSGTHKYYVEYRQGEQAEKPEDPDIDMKQRLEKWLQMAEEADRGITGNRQESPSDSSLILLNTAQNNSRIKNIISMIHDREWHYFYLIGKNYIPQTTVIGASFDAEYSVVNADSFSIGTDRYTILRVGVLRRWQEESCTHSWDREVSIAAACLINGRETYQCGKCSKEEAVVLPARGHSDLDKDALCDKCKKRSFSQKKGDVVQSVLKTEKGGIVMSFTCIEEDYRGTGKMLYLADSVLGNDVTGTCFTDGNAYEDSKIRRYFEYVFTNEISIASALQPIIREGGMGTEDYAALLSREEYEKYNADGVIKQAGMGYFLRTADGNDNICAVAADGTVVEVQAEDNTEFGARPFILLDKPVTEDRAEPCIWKEGDVQARKIGKETYLFRCIDEDYSDILSTHRKSALFLCDSVIRSDIDSNNLNFNKLSFGRDNNYKKSDVRAWLSKNAEDSLFNIEPVSIGLNRAYTGSTGIRTFEQMDREKLAGYDIGFQLLQDKLFCLSVEEAVKYRDKLWRFNGSQENNPGTQISPYSAGYYLRTPFFARDISGKFSYSKDIYVVDLEQGNIHTVKTEGTTAGIRPAFVLPQE